MTERILLSLDGSATEGHGAEATDRAIDHALASAERTGGTVHALYVVDTGRYGEPALSSAEIFVDDAEDAGHDLLAAVDRRGRERGVTVLTRCCHGRPNEELPAYAAEIDADTVVLAGRRRPGRVRKELERVADTVVAPGALVGR
ncbi:universal stress protein [Halosimplex rubrum]|uniref:Universal stress protein n=1 Tax=Halosimplex rubrum TaxID=869889 RepID=A0A7D5SNU5_9EURY|nr:universal stress protein [Halosimplex rubrum]QLH76007.1 universal stress protein [Halosimplex rubrum]